MILDGKEVSFEPGETILEIAQRNDVFIPTLCFDPRLKPFGSCRMCVVDVKGIKNPVASCTMAATAGMEVQTSTEPIEKFRKTLLEMVVSENREVEVSPLARDRFAGISMLVEKYGCESWPLPGETFRSQQAG
jgi:predicted molibdopterin-dependent oxidoreductase YjgC